MEVAEPGRCLGRAAENGVAKHLLFVSAERAESRGRSVKPGGVGGKIALLGPHLVDATSHELSQAHKRVRGEREGEGIVCRYGGEGPPMVEHEGASFPLKSAIRSGHGGVIRERREVREEEGVDHRGKGEAFEEG